MSKPAGESVARRCAVAAGIGVFLFGAILPIWPGCNLNGRWGPGTSWSEPLLNAVFSAVGSLQLWPLNVVIASNHGNLPPMVGGLVVLSALAGVLAYRQMTRPRPA